jgi:acyl-activating enzyme 14
VLLADSAGLEVARGAAVSSPHFIRGICMLDGTRGVDGALVLGDASLAELKGELPPPLPLLRSGLHDDICTLVFTSGSTATPKAVALTHANIGAATAGKVSAVRYAARDVYLHAAPLCHIGGLSSAHAALWAGATHVFPPSGGFRATEMLALIRKHSVTCFIAVPTMLHDLIHAWHAKPQPRQALGSVTRVLLGGGAVPRALLACTAHLVPHATVTGTYALSEACSTVAFRTLAVAGAVGVTPPEPPRDGEGDEPAGSDASAGVCCGSPAPGCLVRIAPSGEICVAGPQVMSGYWADAGASRAALVPADGGQVWLHTGDVGRLDGAGRLWLLGRAADVIKSGGENVHASEVEAALATHPAVASAVVVPVPHDRWGAAVAACVVLAPGATWQGPTVPTGAAGVASSHSGGSGGDATPGHGMDSPLLQITTPAALRAHVTSPAVGLARFKAPVLIASWTPVGSALPLGPTGKVDKRAVGAVMRALALEQTSSGTESVQLRSRL